MVRAQERYQGRQSYADDYGMDADADVNPLPSVRDPKLFSIPCR